MRVKTKWALPAFLGLLALVMAAGPALAQQKTKISGKRFGVVIDSTVHPVGDAKGHVMGISVVEGVDVQFKGTFRNISSLDARMPQGGVFQGWSTFTHPDGDKTFNTFQGKVEYKKSPEGKLMVVFHGTWKFVSGTGKWAGVQGSGTFKGYYLGKKIYTYDWQGEYFIKK